MLTTQAWNALLKTLEEPPSHVKFIFATTEPHKVLPTIVSRCQRFDLKRISVPLIVHRLRQIADGEKISVEDAALAAIARAADGGMRDAQSIFDQMIAFCGGLKADEIIREQDVIDVFGLASGVELREMAAALFTNDLNRGLQILQELADNGRDLERLFADLIGYVRNIMVASLCGNPQDLLEVSDSELADLCAIGKALDPQLVQRVLQGLVAQEWSFRAALNKRIYFEAVLARVMLDAHSVQIDDIMTQLNLISGALPSEQMPPPRPTVVIPHHKFTLRNRSRQETPRRTPAPAPAPHPHRHPPAAPAPAAAPHRHGTAPPQWHQHRSRQHRHRRAIGDDAHDAQPRPVPTTLRSGRCRYNVTAKRRRACAPTTAVLKQRRPCGRRCDDDVAVLPGPRGQSGRHIKQSAGAGGR